MLNATIGDPIKRLAKMNEVISEIYGQTCVDTSYSSLTNQLKAFSWNDPLAAGS